MAHTNMTLSFILFSSLLVSVVQAQQQSRTPHGLAFENPMMFGPSAYDFFHPHDMPAAAGGASPPHKAPAVHVDTSSKAKADAVHQSLLAAPSNGGRLGASGVAAVMFGFLALVGVAMVAAYIGIRRSRASRLRAKTMMQPPDA